MDRQQREHEWTLWMRAALQGDEQSYRRLLSSLSQGLRVIVRSRLQRLGSTPSEAEDVVQEILLALHLKRNTWDPQTQLAPWVAAITRNKLVDTFRRRGQREEIQIDSVIDSLQSGSASDDTDAADVERMLGELSPQQRDIVRSIAIEGRGAQETAAKLRMTEVAVRVALHRSLKALAARFRSDG